MVPDYSYSFAMSSCLIALLPEGFYDRVDEGSIILKKSKKFSFCSNGIILEEGNECIKSDIKIEKERKNIASSSSSSTFDSNVTLAVSAALMTSRASLSFPACSTAWAWRASLCFCSSSSMSRHNE